MWVHVEYPSTVGIYYWSLALPAKAPLEHNFRYPRIREHLYMGGAIALGGRPRTF